MLELLKRFINIALCWFVVAILPTFMFFAVMFIGVHRIFCQEWLSAQCERLFKMLVLGENGAFDLTPLEIELDDDELEIELD